MVDETIWNMDGLLEKVAKMRRLQKDYFKHRDSMSLGACKAAERDVDQELEMLRGGKAKDPELF